MRKNFAKIIKITLVSSILCGLFFPLFSRGQMASPPETLDDAKQLGEKALDIAKNEGPGIIGNIWKNEVVPIWKNMVDWTRIHIWENWLKDWLKNLWHSALNILKIEIEQRKPAIKEEFEKEKREIKEEAPKIGNSLWEKFKELIK